MVAKPESPGNVGLLLDGPRRWEAAGGRGVSSITCLRSKSRARGVGSSRTRAAPKGWCAVGRRELGSGRARLANQGLIALRYSCAGAGDIIEDVDPDWGTTFRRPAVASPSTEQRQVLPFRLTD